MTFVLKIPFSVSSSAFPRLNKAAVRVRRLAAQFSKAAMATSHLSSSPSSAALGDGATAAILIIGDEILKVGDSVLIDDFWFA